MHRTVCLAIALVVCSIRLAAAEEVTLGTVPPVVVSTFPAAGSAEVDSTLKEIRVTFSKTMRDGSWSWSMIDREHFPRQAGDPKFSGDKLTCLLPVELEAGKTYAIWVNSEKLRNFTDTEGRPAVPYLLVFRTKQK